MTVQLAMYKGKGLIGNSFIRWWTGSQYSHCEVVVNGQSYSSSIQDSGVRTKVIDMTDGKWELVDIPWVTAEAVENYFKKTDNQKYGWITLIYSQLFNRNRSNNKSQFCSQWCANAIGMPIASVLSPAALYELVKWKLLDYENQ